MNGCQTNRASQPGLGHLMPILFHWLKSPVQNWKEDKEGSSSWDAKVYYIQTDEKCCSIYSLMNGGSSNVQARFSQPMSLSCSLTLSLSLSLSLTLSLSLSLSRTHSLSLSQPQTVRESFIDRRFGSKTDTAKSVSVALSVCGESKNLVSLEP